MSRSVLVMNPGARGAAEARAQAISDQLRAAGEDVEACLTHSAEEATAIARRAADEGAPRLWAVGGDGTIHSVIQGIMGSQTALAVVPVGTGNILARELGVPLRSHRAVTQLLAGDTIAMDGVRYNDRWFCLFVGIGYDAEVVNRLPKRMKRVCGRLAYVITALRTACRWRPVPIKLVIDGRELTEKAWTVIIANSRTFTGVLDLPEEVDRADGKLNVVIVSTKPTYRAGLRLFGHMAASAMFHRWWIPEAEILTCERVTVDVDAAVPAQIDGELVFEPHMDIEISPGALRVVVPCRGE